MSVKKLLIRKATEDGRYSVAFCWKFQCKMLFGFRKHLTLDFPNGQTEHDSRLAFFVYLILPNVEKNLECTLAHNTSFFASLPRVKTFSGKEIINNWVVSRHFGDNKRQIRDLP